MSKGSATTTTSTAPNPVAGQAYDQLIQQAGQVAATPYQAYTGELTAPINQQQQQGVGTINQYATSAVPYLQGAESTIQGAAQPLTQAQIQQYQSPYTQDVINATEAQFNNQNAQQQQQVLGNAAAQGALGGDRTAVAQSVLAGQQQAQEAPVIAGLENQGYTQALATAGQQFQTNPEQAAYGIASTGTALENAGLTGANAQFGAGTAEQQTQQAQDTAAYQQYEQALQYPFATLGWEAGIDTGVGSQLGGTSSTTAPAPNYLAQDIGAGVGVGAAVLSDKRAKENLKKVGALNDGQAVYRFNYKGDPTTRIGLVAQEVERDRPEAVHSTDGWKSVDYDEATKDAVRRLLGGRVQGLATGGTPYGGTGSMPYSAGVGWVPSLSITGGSGAPKAPGAPNQQQPGVQTPQQMAQNAYKIAGSPQVSSAFNTGTTELASGMNASDLSALTGEDADVSSAALAAMPFGENRGGRVPPYAGLAIPAQNRIQLKRGGGPPVRAGLGMASFMPRRGYADGGSPDDDSVTFDDRFAGAVPQAAPGWAAALSPGSPVAAAYNQENPFAQAPVNQNVPGPTAGVGNAVSYGTPPQGDFPPAPGDAASAAPVAGVAAPEPPLRIAPPTSPSVAPQAGVGAAQPEPMDVYQNTIKHMETGSERNPYGAMVPSVDPKTGATRYAVGAYGVMDSNIPEWTKQALGKPMTVQQFAADPSAQDAVFRAKFGQYADKYGPEGAARAWLAGEGGMNNPNVKDRFGTDPLSYGRKFANSIVGAGMNTPGGSGAQLPTTSTPTQGQAQPQDTPASPPAQKGFGLFGLLSPDIGMSALSAGLGMMASRSPFLGSAIGEGGLQGLNTYSNLQQQHITQAEKQQDLDLKVRALNQAAKSEQDKIAQESKKEQFAETGISATEQAKLKRDQAKLEQEQNQPKLVNPGQQLINPKTGDVIGSNENGLMSDAAVNLAVDRIHAGDPSALQNLGRAGRRQDKNLTRIQNSLFGRTRSGRRVEWCRLGGREG